MNAPLPPAAVSFALAAVTDWFARFDQAISAEGLQRLGCVLLHFLWQGSAVAALLVVALGMLGRQSAAIRCRVACAALLAMVLAPVATYWLIARETPAMTVGLVQPSLVTAPGQPEVHIVQPGSEKRASAAGEQSAPAVSAAPTTTTAAPGARLAQSPWTWVVACWAIGVAGLSAWRAGGWLHLRWLIRRTESVGEVWTDRMQTLARQMGVRRTVRLAQAAWVAVPCVLGFFRPIVLVPAAALTGLTPAQLEAILAHELAHVRRNDYLVNLAQAALETVLFYHPAVWWVSARIREEREYCCDDLAAATRPSPAEYAGALAAAEVMRQIDVRSLPPHLALGALGGGRTNGPLLRRVRRVLGLSPGPTGDRVLVRPLTAVAIAAVCVAMPWVMARAEKPPTTTPPAKAAPTTAPATAPSTAPADEFAAAEPPGPDDLITDKRPYRISPSDLLTIEVSDLTGPGTQTVKTTRVKENGTITMPYLSSPVHAQGLTEDQLEKAIVDRYRTENIIQKAQVTVQLTERRGRTFKVLGDVPQPGQYAIVDPDLRMLDALTLSGADLTKLDRIYVVRSLKIDETARDLELHPTAKSEFKTFHLKRVESDSTTRVLLEIFKPPEDAKEKAAPDSLPYGVNALSDARNNNVLVTGPPEAMKVVEQIIREVDRPQTIVVSAKGLAAGDPKLNVVIYKGDTIIARGRPRSQP